MIMDFTEMPRAGRYKYILVFVCTHTNWPEAFPTTTEKAQEVSKAKILRYIIPRYGIPLHIGSDNGSVSFDACSQHYSRVALLVQAPILWTG